jgi:hypothetical protein
MSLHESRRPALGLACGLLSVSLSFSCTGSIVDDPTGAQPPSKGGGGPSRPGPGGGGTGPEILPPPVGEPACDSTEFTPARVWRLSDQQYAAAVKDLVPGVMVPTIQTPGHSDQNFIDFAEQFEFGPATTSDLRASVTSVAGEAVKNLPALLACKGGEDPSACSNRFIDDFASRAFRRPLDAEEKSGLRAVYTMGAKISQAEGIKMVLSAVLQSASFLYRTELGKTNTVAPGQTIELTAHELASSLSFLFLNSIPDPELRATADDGTIFQADTFKKQVERLLKSPRVQENLTTVYLKWAGLGLGLNADLATQEKEFTPVLKASMEQEVRLFFKDVLTSGGSLTDLMTSRKGFVDRTLATHLGVQAAGADFSPVTYPAGQRAGMLTLPGVIARYSLGHAEVFRGKFVRDELLCQEIPPPPVTDEVEKETKAAENLPPREQAKLRLAHTTCGACHAQMDPLGLSFSNYDALGRYRTTEKTGAAIDSSGDLTGTGEAGVDGPLKNAVELGDRLSRSVTARGCIEGKMLGYALGRLTEKFDKCELKKIDGFVAAGGGKLSDLMAAIVYSSAYRFRTGGN